MEIDKYPIPTSANVTAVMKGNKRSDTRPEKSLRSMLHRRGLRFRKDYPILFKEGGRCGPDIVFTRRKLAIFVDGCFWHLCPDHGRVPKQNTDYWEPKLIATRERDLKDCARLTRDGWKCLRIWEHVPLDDAVRIVLANLDSA